MSATKQQRSWNTAGAAQFIDNCANPACRAPVSVKRSRRMSKHHYCSTTCRDIGRRKKT